MRHGRLTPAALAGVVVLAACSGEPLAPSPSLSQVAQSGSYLLLAGGDLPSTLASRVAAAGGTLTTVIPEIGVAFATSADASFEQNAARIPGIQAVTPDRMVEWIDPDPPLLEVDDLASAESHGNNETFWNAQWAPRSIEAPAAWDAGALGAGARVAILDTGIRNTHIDLAPNFDVAASRSFVPGFAFNTDVGTFWHGTHVAGIIGAADNSIGTIGIAPSARLIGVKVLHGTSGSFEWILSGIVYAAKPIAEGGAGADVINMSLGATFVPENVGDWHLVVAMGRATTYAYQQGVTVVTAAGNDAIDADHTANLIHIPSQSPHAIAVSATGPVGFALGATNFDRPASYSNYGLSHIDFAGPGGDYVLPGTASCSVPAVPGGTITSPCWVFDMVIAPCRGGGTSNSSYCFAAGTSMAAPAVAGVAALVIGGNGGSMNPSLVEAALRRSAEDLGKAGKDPNFGLGRVNARRAVQ